MEKAQTAPPESWGDSDQPGMFSRTFALSRHFSRQLQTLTALEEIQMLLGSQVQEQKDAPGKDKQRATQQAAFMQACHNSAAP